MERRRLLVRGLVQGVGFRWVCARRAAELGLTGWVRNKGDGTVEIVVEGAPDAVEGLVTWAHRGPPGAQVEAVDVTDEAPTGLTGFEIEPRAQAT